MKEFFIETLKQNHLYDWFIREYGEDYEAKSPWKEGWWFYSEGFSYRIEDLFDDDWSEGTSWKYYDYGWNEWQLLMAFEREGYYIESMGCDEGDAWLSVQKFYPKERELVKIEEDLPF
jgi:hypothetical protein